MGESHLSGVEFRDYGNKEKNLRALLEELIGKRLRWVQKNDEITVLVDTQFVLTGVKSHENRIETGHLTLDDTFFELENQGETKIYFPLVQFKGVEKYGRSLILNFDTYRWMVTEVI